MTWPMARVFLSTEQNNNNIRTTFFAILLIQYNNDIIINIKYNRLGWFQVVAWREGEEEKKRK